MSFRLLHSENNLHNGKKTVFLINSPIKDNVTSEYLNGNAFPPLGILTIGTAVKHKTDWDVKVYDAQVTSFKEIERDMERIKPNVVGLSVLGKTYENGLKFAKLAKNHGAITVFGNDHAALLYNNILKNQDDVDVISAGEHGENMFVPFLQALETGIDFADVPDMIYKNENGVIVRNLVEQPKLQGRYKMDQFEIPDRNLLPKKVWDTYLENYLQRYGFMHPSDNVTGVSTINTARGCTRCNSRCAYCGILDLSIKLSSPTKFWKEVEAARQQINANVLYEVFDSMSSVPWWIEELINTKPPHLADTKFILYAQAIDINEKTVDLLKRLGVVMLNMGLDSGDDTMLMRLKGPKDSVEINKNAVELVNKAGMNVSCSFVCGAPGETKESLRNTVNFAKWIADNKLAAAIEANPLTLRKQSKIGSWFDNPEKAKKDLLAIGLKIKNEHCLLEVSYAWNNEDILTLSMDEAYFDIFTNVNYKQIIETADEIVNYAKTKGIGSSEREKSNG